MTTLNRLPLYPSRLRPSLLMVPLTLLSSLSLAASYNLTSTRIDHQWPASSPPISANTNDFITGTLHINGPGNEGDAVALELAFDDRALNFEHATVLQVGGFDLSYDTAVEHLDYYESGTVDDYYFSESIDALQVPGQTENPEPELSSPTIPQSSLDTTSVQTEVDISPIRLSGHYSYYSVYNNDWESSWSEEWYYEYDPFLVTLIYDVEFNGMDMGTFQETHRVSLNYIPGSEVPLPASAGLFAAALGLLGVFRNRLKRQ